MVVARHTIPDETGRVSEIIVGRNIANAANLVLKGPGRVAVLTQHSVSRLAAGIAEGAEELGLVAAVRILPDRDEAKNLRTVESVFEWLNTLGFTRADMAVAVGGGAITDLVGFAAATYLRGIEVTYLPTTLLAAVDASIGGKTGVNVGGKNLAGVFRHPARVVIDLDVLMRLPVELLREGAAETVKAGFIADPAIIAEYESNGVGAALDRVVPAAIAVKVDTVAGDFREAGRRTILNYGHTIGHAVELAAGISHGDAVAIGMVAAGRVSALVTGFAHEQRQRAIIEKIGLPVAAPPVDPDAVGALIGMDKKRDADGIRMVLLEDFGRPVVVHVDDQLIAAGLGAVGIPSG
jgi:3-dehydroquinate synthetase